MAGERFVVLLVLCAASVFGNLLSNNSYKLKQVLVLSRHGIRSPLAAELELMTPKQWPKWKQPGGLLTTKGAMVESFVGAYFGKWLYKSGLIPQGCPDKSTVNIYANLKQRTKETARVFADNAFPNCNVTVHFDKHESDSIFEAEIQNDSKEFQLAALEAMESKLEEHNVSESLNLLGRLIDYKNSAYCKKKHQCDLLKDKNKLEIVVHEKPCILGPLKIGNSVVDAFMMQYYQGFPTNDVAWGEMKNNDMWEELFAISTQYHNIIYNTSIVAKDTSKPLLAYMKNVFLAKEPKFTLLLGHDVNGLTVVKALNIKPYVLKNQYERFPVSGKIVFQKWHDEVLNRYLLKIDHVYLSYEQLRDGNKLSAENPPQSITLELENCKIDKDGYCLWSDFEKILHNL